MEDTAEDTVVLMAAVAAAVASEDVEEVAVSGPVAATATAMVRPVVPRQGLDRTAVMETEASPAVVMIPVAVDAHLMTDLVATATAVTAEIATVGDALAATWSPLADAMAVMALAATVIETETLTDLATTTIGSVATKAVATRILASCVATDDSLASGYSVGWRSNHTHGLLSSQEICLLW